MLRKSFFLLFFILPAIIFTQQNEPPKFALVIGNAAYTNMSRLENPVNDANDMTTVLQNLGFTVDVVLDGNLDQMENAVVRLRSRLSASDESYGFFFYAGHGVQSNGENFLIPVDANIISENFLRQRAVSVQSVLDELNAAGNYLNIVVLDACRDNPLSRWRGGGRGLAVVANQPADSIIVFATSAGSVADDGIGRNGLFTEHLLNNLRIPGLEIHEIFIRTGADVAQASMRRQIPAIYNQFFGRAYLGVRPEEIELSYSPVPLPEPRPVAQPEESRPPQDIESDHWRNKWLYLRTSWDFPVITTYLLREPVTLYYNEDYPPRILDHNIAINLGATIGLEVQFLNWMSLEGNLILRFSEPENENAFIPGVGLQLKFPLKPARHFMLEPYIMSSAVANKSGSYHVFPTWAVGGGMQFGVKGRSMGAFFIDANYLHSIGNVVMDYEGWEPRLVNYSRQVISIGFGYKIGFLNRN